MHQLANLPTYLLCLTLLLASGCTLLQPPPTPTPLPTPIRWPTATPEPPDTGWQPLQPGVELRRVLVEADSAAAVADGGEYLAIIRLDPSTVHFRVHYSPGQPLKVSAWAEQLQSLLVVNAGYFTPEYEATGLLISDGQTWGAVYGDFAGLFAVTADDQVSVRWLHDQPYDPAEPLTQGVMSFPVLVKPGGVMGFPADADDGMHARRTVVAQDFDGRILFIAAPRGPLSLYKMAVFLAGSDLGIDVALNLDGGPSTGLWLATEANPVSIDSRAAVPSVISVTTR
jgi:uncharacterized protein YigE (DUF2233 family)